MVDVTRTQGYDGWAPEASPLSRAPTPDDVEHAIRRTVRRYASAPLPDRVYVGMKLRRDPLLGWLAGMTTSFGRVVDFGCGRGQLGLALIELGLARSVVGFDFDERKVELARQASRGDARFETGDVSVTPVAAADTLLLIDVLYYLSRADQAALLERAASAVEKSGRLLIRVLDARRARWFWLTRLAEAATTAVGYNRARTLHYRPIGEAVRTLEACGLRVERFETSQGTPFCHVLLAASHVLHPGCGGSDELFPHRRR
jgi:2-polyprenyl-3-methyl-5-hydroxy-6-metoxy-1,4-benzoquinol methylase